MFSHAVRLLPVEPPFRRGSGPCRMMSDPPEFAAFGAPSIFSQVKPTGNLYRPEIETFLRYSRQFFANRRYTDGGELCRLMEERLARFHGVEHVVAVNSGFWGH